MFGAEDCFKEDEEKAISELKSRFGEDVFERLVSKFEDARDCNIADNDTWHNVIERLLNGED